MSQDSTPQATTGPDDITAKIERLQRAEEEVRRLQDELIDDAETNRAPTIAALREAVIEGLGEGEGVEAAIALVPIIGVLAELDGPDVCDMLVDALGCEEPEVRQSAGHALQELAFDRFKEVANAIERAITRLPADSHALRELPFVITEVGEPGAPKILRGYLAHAEAEIVAAAIEALALGGDPSAIAELQKLVRDTRSVTLSDDDAAAAQSAQASIGILAREAIALLSGDDDEPAPKPSRPSGPSKGGPGGGAPNRGGPSKGAPGKGPSAPHGGRPDAKRR